MTCLAPQMLVDRMIAETGIDKDRLSKWFDWLEEEVLHPIRSRRIEVYTPTIEACDEYAIFCTFVPLDSRFSSEGSVHEQLENLELLPTIGERGIYHITDEGLNWPVIGIRRS